MPCTNDYPDEPMVLESSHKKLRDELDCVTRLLCGLCRRVRNDGKDQLIVDDTELGIWWARHEAWDRKREDAEQAELERKAKKQNALKKLTDEEKQLLGIKL